MNHIHHTVHGTTELCTEQHASHIHQRNCDALNAARSAGCPACAAEQRPPTPTQVRAITALSKSLGVEPNIPATAIEASQQLTRLGSMAREPQNYSTRKEVA